MFCNYNIVVPEHIKVVTEAKSDDENCLTLSDAGGGVKCPPSHTFAIPRKKSMGKVANFFLLFLNM